MDNIPAIATYERVQSLVVQLKEAENIFYGDSHMSFDKLTSHLSVEATDILRAYIDQRKHGITDGENTKAALVELITHLQSIEKITITTAIDLSNDFVSKLHTWLQKNLGTRVAIECFVDKNILGGLVIWWRGRYIDLSLKPRMAHTYN